MKRVTQPRFRKFSPIDREHPIFELIQDDEILLEVSLTDSRELEVVFHAPISSAAVSFDDLLEILREGRRLAEEAAAVGE